VMTSEGSQKICIECRALVPQEAKECPECGYPFGDPHTLQCRSCNSVIVDDVQNCPVCGQCVAQLPQEAAESVYVEQELREESVPLAAVPPEVFPPQLSVQYVNSDNGLDYTGIMTRLDAINSSLHSMAGAIQASGSNSAEIIKLIRESSAAVGKSIGESQAANQRVLQETIDVVKVVYEAIGTGSIANLGEQIAELKTSIVDVAEQQKESSSQLAAAIKELGDRVAENKPPRFPVALKWLDYMFIVIVVLLIFSIGNLLVMAYIARLLMMQE